MGQNIGEHALLQSRTTQNDPPLWFLLAVHFYPGLKFNRTNCKTTVLATFKTPVSATIKKCTTYPLAV